MTGRTALGSPLDGPASRSITPGPAIPVPANDGPQPLA